MQDAEINSLIAKYIDGEATEKETELIDDWYESFETRQGLKALLSEDEMQAESSKSFETFKAKLHPKS